MLLTVRYYTDAYNSEIYIDAYNSEILYGCL